jgi:TonB-linked SusC/RagA family outer membrane protein
MTNIYTSDRGILISKSIGKRLLQPERFWQVLCFAFLIIALSVSDIFAQVTVSGSVTSTSSNEPLAGVNILEKGTSTGTSTNGEGAYELTVSGSEAILVFTYIGFKPKEVAVGDKRTIDISLAENVEMMEDLVVIGYGTQERGTLTSSVSSISSEEIEDSPSASTENILQGRVSGVEVQANTGIPGSGMFIKIRGTTSISGGSEPLYVVDGVPIESGSISSLAGKVGSSAIADLNPSNIASMEILKDASATAIYGARASNGVVLITTKRGANAKPVVEISSSYGFQSLKNRYKIVKGPTFERLQNEAYLNNGGNPNKLPYSNPSSAISTDWWDYVYNGGAMKRNHNISVSGGNEDITYRVSVNNLGQEGIIKPVTFERTNGRVNLDFNANDKLKFTTSMMYANTDRDGGIYGGAITGVMASTAFLPTNIPPYQTDGSYTKFSIFENPIAATDEIVREMKGNRFLGTATGQYEFMPNLSLKSIFSYDINNRSDNTYYNTRMNNGVGTNGSGSSTFTKSYNWTQDNTLNYEVSIGPNNISALVGTSLQESTFERTGVNGEQFPNNSFTRVTSAAVTEGYNTISTWGITSFFGRLDYDYKGKYLATANIRRDGSSRFGRDNRWGTFPSFSLGWRLSEEPFLQTQGHWLSNLKIRGSYGITGNQSGVGNFQSRGLWGGVQYVDSPGITPNQIANPDLKWESTKQLDLGLNVGLFNNRITLVYDYYHKQTSDLLLAVPVPKTTGYSSTVRNFGELSNTGMELSISAAIFQNGRFTWNSKLNLTGNRNTVSKLAAPLTIYPRDMQRAEEGKPLYSFWMHKQTGVDPETGNIKFADINGDGHFDPNTDRTIVGNAQPDFTGGFTNSFNYSNFDLNIFFNFSYGNKTLNVNRLFQEHGGTRNTGFFESQLDRWQEPGDQTMIPKMTNENYAPNLYPSRFLEDGSYLKLKNLTLGYTFPRTITKIISATKFRIYVSAQNLLTFTKYSGLDPEVNFSNESISKGMDMYSMPRPRIVQGGFSLKF